MISKQDVNTKEPTMKGLIVCVSPLAASRSNKRVSVTLRPVAWLGAEVNFT